MANKSTTQKQYNGNINDTNVAESTNLKIAHQEIVSIAHQQIYPRQWYKLDNAGLLYPLSATRYSYSLFAISVKLNSIVCPIKLQQATNCMVKRFPTITGTVKKGMFWHYIDKPDTPLTVCKQQLALCRKMPLDGNCSQVRISYTDNQINVEFFHTATDGRGAVTFVNSLLLCYFKLCGHNVLPHNNAYDHCSPVSNAEIADNFVTVSNTANKNTQTKLPPLSQKLAGKKLSHDNYRILRAIVNTTALKNCAKQHNVSVTALLCACAMLSLRAHNNHNCKRSCKNKLTILVPVDIRQRYNLQSVRNLSNFVLIQDNGITDKKLLLSDINEQLQSKLTLENLAQSVNTNVKYQKNIIMRTMPLVIKKALLKILLKRMGEGAINCATLSNIGIVNAPTEYQQLVKEYKFTLGRTNKNTVDFAIISHNQTTCISITSCFVDKTLERTFCRQLAQLGLSDIIIEGENITP